jgi:hypothetical protein
MRYELVGAMAWISSSEQDKAPKVREAKRELRMHGKRPAHACKETY